MKIFISHSVKGELEKEEFARNLFEMLLKNKFDPFLDLQLLEAGDLWEDKLSDTVQSCDAAIILFTRKATESSKYILKELNWITGVRRSKGIPIIPLYLDDVTVKDLKTDKFAPFDLDRIQGIKINESPNWISQVLAILKSASESRLSEFIQSTLYFGEKLPYLGDRDELPSLSTVYIEQRLSKYEFQSAANDQFTEPDENTKVQIDQQDDESILQALQLYRNILLEGRPGSGKSTLLKYLALQLTKTWQSGEQRDLLPVYVSATGLAKYSQVFSNALHSEVSSYLPLTALAENFFATPPTNTSHWLVLIDAVDEIADISSRRKIIDKIVQIASLPTSSFRFVVTTRPLKDASYFPKETFEHYYLKSFSFSDVKSFADKWFSGPGEAKNFLYQIQESLLINLARDPLLLTMSAFVLKKNGSRILPRIRADLYQKFLDIFLNKPGWESFREQFLNQWKVVGGNEGENIANTILVHRRELLEHIAEKLYQGSNNTILQLAVLWVKDRGRESINDQYTWLADREDWLNTQLSEILRQSGLVNVLGEKQFFLHTTFQEFLLASCLYHRNKKNFSKILSAFDNWQEVKNSEIILFALGLGSSQNCNVAPVLRQLISSGEDGLLLAGLALAEGITADLKLDEEIIRKLIKLAKKFDFLAREKKPNVAEVLGLIKGRELVSEGLLELARDKKISIGQDWFVYSLARLKRWDELGKIALDQTVKNFVRVSAAGFLGPMQGSIAYGVLKEIIDDKTTDVYDRIDAIEALGRTGATQEAAVLFIYLIKTPEFSNNHYTTARALVGLGALGRTEEAFEGILALLRDPQALSMAGDFTDIFEGLVKWGMVYELLPYLQEISLRGVVTFKIAMWMANQGKREDALKLLSQTLAESQLEHDYLSHAAAFYCTLINNQELIDIIQNEHLNVILRYEALLKLSGLGKRIEDFELSKSKNYIDYANWAKEMRLAWKDTEFGLVTFRNLPLHQKVRNWFQGILKKMRFFFRRGERFFITRRNKKIYHLLTDFKNAKAFPGETALSFIRNQAIHVNNRIGVIQSMVDLGETDLAHESLMFIIPQLRQVIQKEEDSENDSDYWFFCRYSYSISLGLLLKIGGAREVHKLLSNNAIAIDEESFFEFLTEIKLEIAIQFCIELTNGIDIYGKDGPRNSMRIKSLKILAELKAFTELLGLVSSDSAPLWIKVYACRQLKESKAIPELVTIALDMKLDNWIRSEAAEALSNLDQLQFLIDFSKNVGDNVVVRRHAIWALGEKHIGRNDKLLKDFLNIEKDEDLRIAWKDAIVRNQLGEKIFANEHIV
jgi:hypothetical protein